MVIHFTKKKILINKLFIDPLEFSDLDYLKLNIVYSLIARMVRQKHFNRCA